MVRAMRCLASLALLLAAALPVQANLITNGNFETGDFTGWTVVDRAGGDGTWFVDAPGSTTPVSDFPTLGTAANGNWYAVTDQGGPGTHVLLQSFVANFTQVRVSWDMFINDQSGLGPIINPAGLDHTVGANQHARVDVLTAAAPPFSTAGGDIVANLYIGVDPGANPNPFSTYSIVVSGLTVGSTYQLRFGEVDNEFYFHMGVDNVSVVGIPEPSSLTLVGMGTFGLVARVIRRRLKQ